MGVSIVRLTSLAIGLSVSLIGSTYAASNTFVDEASTAGRAEIETSKLALQKSSSADVKAFASQMVIDHTAINKELAALAGKLDIEVPDDAALGHMAEKMALQVPEGASFDAAYAKHQVDAHEQTLKLFTKRSRSTASPAELAAFASKALPTMQHHLDMAKKLQAQHQKIN